MNDAIASETGVNGVALAHSTCRCGRGRSDAHPSRCLAGHVWKGAASPALAVGRHSEVLARATQGAADGLAEAFVRQAGYASLDEAPADMRAVAVGLGQAVTMRNHFFAAWSVWHSPRARVQAARAEQAADAWLSAGKEVLPSLRALKLITADPKDVAADDPFAARLQAVARG